MLLLVVCVAVGATIVGAEADIDEEMLDWPGYAASEFVSRWHAGVLAGITLLLIAGLVSESRDLRLAQVPAVDPDLIFGVQFARGWRTALAGVMALCVLAKTAISRGLFEPPESLGFYCADPFTKYLWCFALIIALTAGVHSYGGMPPARRVTPLRTVIDIAVLGGALGIGAYVLLDYWTVPYLVHLATASVDSYLKQADSRFAAPTFEERQQFERLAALAYGGLIVAAMTGIVALRSERLARTRRLLPALTAALALAVCGSIAWRFFRTDFPRLSPDLAGAGLASTWWLAVGGAALAAVATTTAAYRIVALRKATCAHAIAIQPAWSFHYSRIAMLILTASTSVILSHFWEYGLTDAAYLVTSYDAYMELMIVVLAAKLIWLRTRRGRASRQIVVAPLSRRRFFAAWAGSAMWLAVAVPTLAASCYLYYFGPWFLRGGTG